mmetsp:Transcript_3535/g.7144  ORF Transcript_3535/g.7144 Transcript_3535/m.7144 type:complete len:438 (-) Transcript_3535:217-1530(-)
MASPLLKTTSKAASTAAIAPSSDAITSSSAASSSAAASAPTKPAADAAEGCRACGKDDDHANLLLCEACNDEYHTYCLNPPLSSVPEGDFFCVKCKHIHSSKNDDGLDSLVSALPPSFTSRFGEIVWAAGGVGFGWWPACIYDPRLTVGGARQLARKNLGRKHLVYFFECNDAPFTVLSDHRLTKWDEGFLEEYDLGKIAKSSKSRSASFEKALHVAMLENGRPMELRMDWNHQGTLTANQPKLSKGKQNTINSPINENQNPNKKHKPSPPTSPEMNVDAVKVASSHKIGHILVGHNAQSTSLNRTNMISAVTSLASRDKANPIEPLENGTLVCKILRKKKVTADTGVTPFWHCGYSANGWNGLQREHWICNLVISSICNVSTHPKSNRDRFRRRLFRNGRRETERMEVLRAETGTGEYKTGGKDWAGTGVFEEYHE